MMSKSGFTLTIADWFNVKVRRLEPSFSPLTSRRPSSSFSFMRTRSSEKSPTLTSSGRPRLTMNPTSWLFNRWLKCMSKQRSSLGWLTEVSKDTLISRDWKFSMIPAKLNKRLSISLPNVHMEQRQLLPCPLTWGKWKLAPWPLGIAPWLPSTFNVPGTDATTFCIWHQWLSANIIEQPLRCKIIPTSTINGTNAVGSAGLWRPNRFCSTFCVVIVVNL